MGQPSSTVNWGNAVALADFAAYRARSVTVARIQLGPPFSSVTRSPSRCARCSGLLRPLSCRRRDRRLRGCLRAARCWGGRGRALLDFEFYASAIHRECKPRGHETPTSPERLLQDCYFLGSVRGSALSATLESPRVPTVMRYSFLPIGDGGEKVVWWLFPKGTSWNQKEINCEASSRRVVPSERWGQCPRRGGVGCTTRAARA
jgi:hypothetical protein